MPTDDLATGTASATGPAPRSWQALIDRTLIRMVTAAFGRLPVGRLQLTLPSGLAVMLGAAERDVMAQLTLNNYRLLWQVLRRGPLGFAECHMAGDVDTDSLHDVFRYYIDSGQALQQAGAGLVQSGWRDRTFHRNRANTPLGSKRNIAAHYDLGNAFYRLWLDDGLNYSSGIHAGPATTLEAAQAAKLERIMAALELRAEHHVLEIGCGWGAFAEAAARRVAGVTGITISQAQFAASSQRMVLAGLDDRVQIRFEDYRDTTGQFDRIASIEMIEAVGEDNWARYFSVVADRLKLGGIGVIQAITIEPEFYDGYRRNPDFIQRYIFPGGMLPTVSAMQRHAGEAGLGFETLETFGASYALTLAEWRRRFTTTWPRIAALGFDDRFRRMWLYYLAYCEVGFERGIIDVGLYRVVRRG